MGIRRRLHGGGQIPPQPFAPFIASIVHNPLQAARWRARIVDVPQVRAQLAAGLRQKGLSDPETGKLPAGRLVGVCPRCSLRLSAEYLEWLLAADVHSTRDARRVARFLQGQCVNEECPSTDIVLHWRP